MTNIEIVKVLLSHMGNSTEQDKALAAACIVLLDEVMTGKEEEKKPKAKKPTEPKKPKVDHGKICATYKAGWTINEIAKEIGASVATVRCHLQKEGLIK